VARVFLLFDDLGQALQHIALCLGSELMLVRAELSVDGTKRRRYLQEFSNRSLETIAFKRTNPDDRRPVIATRDGRLDASMSFIASIDI
jgi:hypothetical protein